MTAVTQFTDVLAANQPLWFALFALAAVDLLAGAGRALISKTFTSTVLRQTCAKVITEAGLPLVVAILAVANGTFAPFVAIALWVAVVSEATSIIEQIRGKQSAALAKTLLGLLNEIKAHTTPTASSGGSSTPPTTGGAA